MISNSKQNWAPGSVVKAGFLSLIVKAAIPTPGDSYPDAYILSDKAGVRLYKFVPHNGLSSISVEEAKEMLDLAELVARGSCIKALKQAAEVSGVSALFADYK